MNGSKKQRKKRERERKSREKERKRKDRLDRKRVKETLKLKKHTKIVLPKPPAKNKASAKCLKKKTANVPSTAKQKPRAKGVTLKRSAIRPCQCPHCDGTYMEEKQTEIERFWVQCYVCEKWMHGDGWLPVGFFANIDGPFRCPDCWD